jgi:glucose-1-phosphate adenylyltransferase
MPNVVTLILAGGQGTRLYPLTKIRSKPAVPIAGKFRLIDIPISNSIHSNFKQIFIITQFATESIHRHIFSTYRFSSFTKHFITILAAQQTSESKDWYQGTADAVRQNLSFIQNYGDYVLILSGDHLYRMDYRKFVDYHIEQGADISISVIPVREENTSELGIMKVSGDSRITDFQEKPTDPKLLASLKVSEKLLKKNGIEARGRQYLASMGIYVFKKKVLNELLENTTTSDFGKEVIPQAISNKKVSAYFFDGYWEDIGTIRAFFNAQLDLAMPLPQFNFYDEDRPIFSHPRFIPGAKVLHANMENVLLCDGSIVNSSEIHNSIIGIRSIVGSNCYLDRVVLMGADYFETPENKQQSLDNGIPPLGIGNNCEIRNAIIDKNARIGHNVRIVNTENVDRKEGDGFFITDGIVVVNKKAVIPDNTVI